MSSVVPEGWYETELHQFVNVSRGYAFKSSDYRSSGNPIVRVTNITNSNKLDLTDNIVFLDESRTKEFESYLLKNDDFLLVMVGATVGKYAEVNTNGRLLFLNQNMWRLSVHDGTNSQRFAIYGLQKVVEEFLGTMQGSAREFLTQKDFGKAPVLLPPLPEQKKIASILTSVDEVIENTQKQIDKLQDLKKATMNELLTKGIGHTEFKDSELGRIPKSWEVVSLRSLASQIKRGPSLSCNTKGHGVRYITSGNLVAGEVSLNGDYKFLDNFPDIEKCRLVANDLVLNCVNSSAKIGESAIFELDIEAIVGFNNYAITLESAVCVPRFVHHFCQTYLFRAQLKTVIKDAINQVSFSTKDLDLIRIALPSLDEQYRIAESINVIWMKEKTNQSQIDKLQSLKKSLMQDLLTGKVRVTVN